MSELFIPNIGIDDAIQNYINKQHLKSGLSAINI